MTTKMKIMNLRLLLTILPLLLAVLGFAQSNGQLRGTVMNGSGAILPGATVQLLSSSGQLLSSASTDNKGVFLLNGLKPATNYTLSVTMVGFDPYKDSNIILKDGAINSLLIRLKEADSALDEVVVIGYGKQKKSNLTTAVGSVENVKKNLERPVSSVGDLLQGNMAGVTVMSAGGDPSSMPRIMIRGMGSMNEESPLYVVDGVPYYGGPINPNDIEKIDVLKDAAAAAIYGAQASSGVIVITTKSGQSGKPRLDVDLYKGWHTANNLPTALNAEEYAKAYTDAAKYAGDKTPAGHDPKQNPWGQVTRTNWMDEIFRTGQIVNANVQLSGGSEKSRYSSSFGYHDKDGVLLNTNYQRISYRVKSEFNLTDRLTIGQNLYINSAKSHGANTSSGYSGTIINAIYMNPAAPVYDDNGKFHGTVPFDLSGFSSTYGDTYNPVALLLRPNLRNPSLNVNGNAFASYQILDGLLFKSNFAIDVSNNFYKLFEPKVPEIGRASSQNYLTQSTTNTRRWIWDQQLNYTKRFGQHNIDLLGVYSAQKTKFDRTTTKGEGFVREEEWYQYMGNAEKLLRLADESEISEDALVSMIGRASYDYADRYFASASIRKDRTSRLAQNVNSDVFPSVSAGWKISSEEFFNVPFINLLKIRSSWGQIGNIQSVDPYAYNVPLATSMVTPLGSGEVVRHVALNKLSNQHLKWETSESFNVGLDVFFLNKFNLTVDYYSKKTIGMILENDANPHSGMKRGATVNAGDVRNKGIEIVASYQDRKGDWTWGINANIAANRNELLNLNGFSNSFIGTNPGQVRGVLYPYRSTAGQPLYSYYLIPSAGLFNSASEIEAYTKNNKKIQPNARPGDLKFVDTNGDGVINDQDRVYMGSAMPKFTYGLNLATSYKNFDLNILSYGVAGNKIFNGYKFTTFNAGLQGYNLDNRVLNAWRPDNMNTDIPVLSTKDPNNNFGTSSDWYLEKGDYFRVKNIAVGYTLPQSLLQKLGTTLRSRIYMSAENPFTFTKYSGIDPEVGTYGLDMANYPLPKTYTIGINVNF